MKTTKLILGILCGIIIVGTLGWLITTHILNQRHSQWLEHCVAEIKSLSSETNWIAGVIESMHATPEDELGRHFISPDLVVMTNGEWIIYRAATHKQGTAFPELFVGLASDEKWYYTTYHFCHQMMVLGADGQPPSLEYFVTNYYLVPYTEQPYEKLTKTWPLKE